MDSIPAQPTEEVSVPSVSPLKKFLPFILGGVLIFLLLVGSLLLFSPTSSNKDIIPTPTIRPTATPFLPPTLPVATKVVSTVSASIVPEKIGRLAFIKNSDIYNSDFASFSLFIKNATPAADKLSWSADGNLLAWREATASATPSAMTVFRRENKTAFSIKPSHEENSELIDYAWSSDEKQIAILYRDSTYHIDLFKISSSSAQKIPLLSRSAPIKKLLWPNGKTMIFSAEDGVSILDIISGTPQLLADNTQVLSMNLSPDKTKLLVGIGTEKKSDLFIIKLDGSGSLRISPKAEKIDMGTTNLPAAILDNGFIPYGLWFPKSDKLLVGYHYLTNLPLTGIYDLTASSFSALSTFAFYENDLMVDDLRLMGARVNTFSSPPSWQLSFFTIEDNAKLATVRVIPEASSPAFFGDDLLPAENTF